MFNWRNAASIRAMLGRHGIGLRDLKSFVAGADVFSKQSDGTTVASQYSKLGIQFKRANMDWQNGWAEILRLLGDAEGDLRPTLFLQHDPNRP
ncbi:MAG TPA: hypothetical protein VMZ27_11430, partial [Candidatus Saccharimonadales bacterium]|nr:hypothetical protein [Candidatus Saccharimonadales bacterium]